MNADEEAYYIDDQPIQKRRKRVHESVEVNVDDVDEDAHLHSEHGQSPSTHDFDHFDTAGPSHASAYVSLYIFKFII